jgi:hypothetical protein
LRLGKPEYVTVKKVQKVYLDVVDPLRLLQIKKQAIEKRKRGYVEG